MTAEAITNAREYPKTYYARHMFAGLAGGYEDGSILIENDTILEMAKSFEGKPVYIMHDDRTDEERLSDIKEKPVGYVTDSFYNEADGWHWVKFIVIDDEGHEAIAKGWAVSNAYIPEQYAEGGSKHGIAYDKEVIAGRFTHLALVPNPRYEDAKIFTPDDYKKHRDEKTAQLIELKNSKSLDETKGSFMNLFRREKKEVSKVDAETFVEIKNDDGTVTEVSVADMAKAVSERKNEVEKDKEEKMNMDAEIEVGDETMTVGELVNRYKNMCDEKKNESEEDDKENESDEDLEEEKKNAKEADYIAEVKNASRNYQDPVRIDTMINQVARGKNRY